MKRSPELEALTAQGIASFASEGLDYFTNRIAHEEGALAIGTDPAEWWSGHDKITSIFRAQSEAMRGMPVVRSAPRAYSEGSVGWAADEVVLRLPDGNEMPIRLTMVYHREDDEWRVVQWHASLGVANEETFGEGLPT